jgi:hypothetical protein
MFSLHKSASTKPKPLSPLQKKMGLTARNNRDLLPNESKQLEWL